MNEETSLPAAPSQPPPPPELPKSRWLHLLPAAERHAHVAQRMLTRGGIAWQPAQVLALEKRIKFVRQQLNQIKPVAPIMPKVIGMEKEKTVHFYRCLVAGQPHTFVWSQLCRGLISYRGPGELTDPSPAPTPAHKPFP